MMLREIGKIFGLKRVLLLAAFAALYYLLFFRLDVGVDKGTSEYDLLQFSLEMAEKYGEDMDEAEYGALAESLAEIEESEVDIWIRENEDFKQYGIKSYRDWIERRDLNDAAKHQSSQLEQRFTMEEQRRAQELAFRQIYTEQLLEVYGKEAKSGEGTTYYSEMPERSLKRIAERNQEEVYSLMPYGGMMKYRKLLPDFALFLFLSMIFLIVPYSVKDTMEGVSILQYAAQKGYGYYWRKMAAVFVSALILCTIEIGWLALMLNENHAFSFAGCYVSGFWNPFITFVKLTFGQYMGASIAYVAGMALCIAMTTYALSGFARNYISAIAFQLPGIVFGFVVSIGLMPGFAEITQNVALLGTAFGICILAAGIGNAARFVCVRKYEQY